MNQFESQSSSDTKFLGWIKYLAGTEHVRKNSQAYIPEDFVQQVS